MKTINVLLSLANAVKVTLGPKGKNVVLERSLVIYGDPVDVTDVVITRLNSQLKTVPVKRERLPRQ